MKTWRKQEESVTLALDEACWVLRNWWCSGARTSWRFSDAAEATDHAHEQHTSYFQSEEMVRKQVCEWRGSHHIVMRSIDALCPILMPNDHSITHERVPPSYLLKRFLSGEHLMSTTFAKKYEKSAYMLCMPFERMW